MNVDLYTQAEKYSKHCVFEWKHLEGKTLKIHVSESDNVTVVMAKCLDTEVIYVLNVEEDE